MSHFARESGEPADWAAPIPPPGERVRAQAPMWFGLLGGPLAWGLHLGLSYLIVPHVCVTGQTVWLHVITVIAAVLAALAVVVAHRVWSAARRAGTPTVLAERDAFAGMAGIVLSGLFLAATLAGGLQSLLIDPCL